MQIEEEPLVELSFNESVCSGCWRGGGAGGEGRGHGQRREGARRGRGVEEDPAEHIHQVLVVQIHRVFAL
jgi:hypothetical protein